MWWSAHMWKIRSRIHTHRRSQNLLPLCQNDQHVPLYASMCRNLLAYHSWIQCSHVLCPYPVRTGLSPPKYAENITCFSITFCIWFVWFDSIYIIHMLIWWNLMHRLLTFWKSLNCWYLDNRSSCVIPRWIPIAGKFCSVKSCAKAIHLCTDFTNMTTYTE